MISRAAKQTKSPKGISLRKNIILLYRLFEGYGENVVQVDVYGIIIY